MMRRLMESVEAKRRGEKQGGFTLIELIVVVVIIGILAAVAIPSFLSQRTRAFDSAVISDSRNVAVEMESFFAGNLQYPTEANALGEVNISTDVTLVVHVNNAANNNNGAFVIVGDHARTESTFVLQSDAGQAPRAVEGTAAAAAVEETLGAGTHQTFTLSNVTTP